MIEPPPNATSVHAPHGFVALKDSCASDLDVVNAARVSFNKESYWGDGSRLTDADTGVLNYMLKNKHGSPFEHTFFKFHVRAPIFVFREWHRHRIGISINEESARYVPLEPDFYLPDDDHCRKQVGKPGHYTYEPMSHGESERLREDLAYSYRIAYDVYSNLTRRGAAKEVARAALPVGIYSQMLWSCNARSLMAFLSLRNAPDAQREIHDYAEAMEAKFAVVMPATHAAFIANGRVAP